MLSLRGCTNSVVAKDTVSAMMKLASEIDELASDGAGNGVVSHSMTSPTTVRSVVAKDTVSSCHLSSWSCVTRQATPKALASTPSHQTTSACTPSPGPNRATKQPQEKPRACQTNKTELQSIGHISHLFPSPHLSTTPPGRCVWVKSQIRVEFRTHRESVRKRDREERKRRHDHRHPQARRGDDISAVQHLFLFFYAFFTFFLPFLKQGNGDEKRKGDISLCSKDAACAARQLDANHVSQCALSRLLLCAFSFMVWQYPSVRAIAQATHQ